MSSEIWTLDPTDLTIKTAKNSYTLSEFGSAQKPPCPVCGTPIDITPVHTPTRKDRDSYILGRWACPNGCDPRGPSLR